MEKLEALKEILKSYRKVAIAYSGGCDSNFLYQVAINTLGKDNVLAVLCNGKMMSRLDLKSAQKLGNMGQLVEVPVDVFQVEAFKYNRKDRCYHCKKTVMAKVIEQAHLHGFEYVLDGLNADDLKVYRPGKKACHELGIISPLAKVNLSKNEIRQYSKELNISTYSKPANACLASRFPYDTLLTSEKLALVQQGEELFYDLGINHVRLRVHGDIARIEVAKENFDKVINSNIVEELKKIGFKFVTLDLEGITSGSYDR